MIATLKRWKKKQAFNPGLMGFLVNPFFFARRGLYRNICKLAPEVTGRVLDVGCGQKPYKNLFKCSEYIGMDIEQSGHTHEQEEIDVFYDGKTFPFQNNSFDSVLCNQVFEHVFNPQEFLSEIHRVLKPNGMLLLTVPFVWDEHEQPFDYGRYSSFGLVSVLEQNGLKVIKHTKSVDDFGAVSQLIVLYFYKKLVKGRKYLDFLIILFILSPMSFAGAVLSKIFPRNQDFFLDNVVLAKKNP